MSNVLLTTIDNPFDPFTEYDEWYEFDVSHGYNTCAYLDRVTDTSSNLSIEMQEEDIEKAMDDIIRYDPLMIYKKVKPKKTEP